MPTPPTDEQIERIRNSFKRCREGTVDAIVALLRTDDVQHIPQIVRGIVWRYIHEDVRPALDKATADTALSSLGIDSLTMMEIVLDVQDALDIVIEDSDLKKMRTIGDVVEFLQQRFGETHPAAS